MIKPDAFIAIEKSLSGRMAVYLRKACSVTFAKIEKAVLAQNWEEASRLVGTINLSSMFEGDEYVTYITNIAMLFGASRVTPNPGTSVVGLGYEKLTSEQAVNSFKQNTAARAEQYLKTMALQLIAQAKLSADALQQVEKANPYHDAEGLFTSKDKAVPALADTVFFHGTSGEYLDSIKANGLLAGGSGKRSGRPEHYVGDRGEDVYLTLDPGAAQRYAAGATKLGATTIVFSIKFPEGVDVREDPWATLAVRHKGRIPPEWIIGVSVDGIYQSLTAKSGAVFYAVVFLKSGEVVQKAKRVLRPFASFMDEAGRSFMNVVSSLHTSRVSAYGFTAEASALGMEFYQITEQLDNRICPVCREMHGKRFKVADARSLLDIVLRVDNPDDLKSLQPWPSQSKENLANIKAMSPEELVSNGWHIPPFHPGCRGLLTKFGTVQPAPKEGPIAPAIEKYTATLEDFLALGKEVTPATLNSWNGLVGLSPTEVLARLKGVSVDEYLVGLLGAENPAEFSGLLRARGEAGWAALGTYAKMFGSSVPVSTTIIFKESSLELDMLQLSYEDRGKSIAKPFMKELHSLAKETGKSFIELKANIDIGAYAFASYGFAPDADIWAALKKDIALDIKKKGLLIGESAETMSLVHSILKSTDPKDIWALADSQVGKKLLIGQVWRGYLYMDDVEAMTRFIDYIG